jgi:hypothetical protein
MPRKTLPKFTSAKNSLVIRKGKDAPLSRTQLEFNRLMKSLESIKARQAAEENRLDETLATSIRELMPLIEDLNRVNRDLVFHGLKAYQTLKLTAERRHWFADLLCGKADELLSDPVGLSEEEVTQLEAVIEELNPGEKDQPASGHDPEALNLLREMLEHAALEAGLDLDLSDLNPNSDPEEFERTAKDRLRTAYENRSDSPPVSEKPGRKLTKAQAEKERKRLEMEEAKNRDLKSLFKQLAKAFHPDLESNPLLKEHKKVWMQRLNSAYAANDLREMLQLEMEWLGEEATKLTTAGDLKLEVYCMVLKEQIADLKKRIHSLQFEPQYGPLQRFIHPFYGTLESPIKIKKNLRSQLQEHQEMLDCLAKNDAASRRMIYDWADENARRSSYQF